MEAIKFILIKSVFCIGVFAQEYSISIFGFHAADVTLKRDSTSNEFETNNRGLFDLIWPASNNYKTLVTQVSPGRPARTHHQRTSSDMQEEEKKQ